MFSEILIISNFNSFSSSTEQAVKELVYKLKDHKKNITMFKEDINLFRLFNSDREISWISALSSIADNITFEELYEDLYSECKVAIKQIPEYEAIYKSALSRYKVPDKSSVFDDTEFDTLRESIMNSRIRFTMSSIAKMNKNIVLFADSKEYNYVNSLKPEYNDGRFLYVFDCSKNRGEFFVGGCLLSDSDFDKFIKGV